MPGQRHEPDQHRKVHVHHERDTEEVGDRQQLVDARRAREHQQDREQARADQRRHAEPQPAARERQRARRPARRSCSRPRTGQRRSGRRASGPAREVGKALIDRVIPPFSASKSMTSTWAGLSVNVASRRVGEAAAARCPSGARRCGARRRERRCGGRPTTAPSRESPEGAATWRYTATPSRSTSIVTAERSRSHFIGVRMLGASLASSSAVNGRHSATRWP